jgi:ATP phosphoribosyltransferase regulatory subunit
MASAERKPRALPPRLVRTSAPLVTPMGMGDLLPPEAAIRRALSLRVLRSFELAGYQLVTPPVFEHADVVARGNDALESRDLLRFVEPESGEVAVLRPDITPQVARIVATRLADRPAPFRLCYEGRVFRRQRGRARNHRQVTQAGVECVGLPFAEGDTEILALAVRACEDAGLQEFRIELSDIRLVRSLLEAVPQEARTAVSEVMAQKDAASLHVILRNGGVGRDVCKQLEALLDHYGERAVLDSARGCFRTARAQEALRSLEEITDRLAELGLGGRVCFDLSETRGLSYYTGMHFSILAHGPGEALGGGGRYDTLLGRFGFDAPATGFALDLGNLQWTLRTSGQQALEPAKLRVAVAGKDGRGVQAVAERLRRADIIAATLPDADAQRCLAFARTWGYDAVLRMTRGAIRLLRVADGSSHTLQAADPGLVRRLAGGEKKRSANAMPARRKVE